MKKIIITTEKELMDLKKDIIAEILEFAKQPYGFKLVSRETRAEITDSMTIYGLLSHPVERVFAEAIREEE